MLQVYYKSSDAIAFLHFSLSHLLIIFEIPILLRYWNAQGLCSRCETASRNFGGWCMEQWLLAFKLILVFPGLILQFDHILHMDFMSSYAAAVSHFFWGDSLEIPSLIVSYISNLTKVQCCLLEHRVAIKSYFCFAICFMSWWWHFSEESSITNKIRIVKHWHIYIFVLILDACIFWTVTRRHLGWNSDMSTYIVNTLTL